jgi:TolB-like protein
MEIVKRALFIFSLSFLFADCGSIPRKELNPAFETQSQNISLDSAIIDGSDYIAGRLSAGSKVAIVNIQSSTVNLTNYIIDNISMHLVNNDSFFVIERSELDAVQNEQHYQLSGEVSDETAVSIGHQFGTQFIITGSILPLGEKYFLRLKIINVETAQIVGTKIYQISKDNTLIALLEILREQLEVKPAKNTPQTVINNTTTINGDVYINNPNGFSWE